MEQDAKPGCNLCTISMQQREASHTMTFTYFSYRKVCSIMGNKLSNQINHGWAVFHAFVSWIKYVPTTSTVYTYILTYQNYMLLDYTSFQCLTIRAVDYTAIHISLPFLSRCAACASYFLDMVITSIRGSEDLGSEDFSLKKVKEKTVFQCSYTLVGIAPIWIFAPNLANHVICFD